jgi:hypothetical protein
MTLKLAAVCQCLMIMENRAVTTSDWNRVPSARAYRQGR